MKRGLLIVAVVGGLSASAVAQAKAAANPVADTVRQLMARSSKNMMAAAEAMPDENYSYKPTPQQRSFGEIVSHTAESNNLLCSSISGLPARARIKPAVFADNKTQAIQALRESFEYCQEAMGKTDDSKLGEEVNCFGGRRVSRAMAMFALTNDWADHYSAMATYMRLKGLLPPTARSEGAPKGGMKPLGK